MHSTLRPILALTLGLACLAGCGGSGAAPAAVTTEFLEALQQDDTARMGTLLTEAARAGLSEDAGFSLSGGDITSFEVGAETFTGSQAEVAVQLVQRDERQDASFLLREVDEGWRVHGVRVAFGDSHITLDFEESANPLASAGQAIVAELGQQLGAEMQKTFDDWEHTLEQGGTLEQIATERARFQEVVAVTPEQHEAAWRTDVKFTDQPARAILAELLGEGWTLDSSGFEAELDRGVSLEATSLSRIEAFERVAREVGLYPVWPSLDTYETIETLTVGFQAGERDPQVHFAGPFAVEVSELTEETPNTVGEVIFTVRSVGIAPSALAYQTETTEPMVVDRLRGPLDEPLSDESIRHLGTPAVHGNYLTYRLSKDLRGLLRSVTTMSASGAVQFELPAVVEPVTWSRDRTDPVETAFGTLSLKSWGESVRFRLEGPKGSSLEDVKVRLSPLKADGTPLGVHFSSSSGWGRALEANVDCPEAPATVELKLCRSQTARHPFAFESIALAHHADQPEQLEPLTFSGAAPLSLEFLGSTREDDYVEATIRAHNRSNKDAVEFTTAFYYLDAGGNVLKDFPHTFSGDWDFDTGEPGPAVLTGATADLASFAAFAPENFTTIRLELQRVTFPDGTSWPVEVQ